VNGNHGGTNVPKNRATNSDANVEPDSSDAALRANEAPRFTSRVCITFHHTRKRLADIDGLSGKAAIDGLVKAGILTNDSAKQVAEVRHFQTKGEPEKTVVTIELTEWRQLTDWTVVTRKEKP
jgi:hypothetical protein